MEDIKNFEEHNPPNVGRPENTPKQRIKNAKSAFKVLKEELKVRELQLKIAQAEAEIKKLESG